MVRTGLEVGALHVDPTTFLEDVTLLQYYSSRIRKGFLKLFTKYHIGIIRQNK